MADKAKSKPLTEGAIKTNVKKNVEGLKAAPPPVPKPAKNAKVAVSRAIKESGNSFDIQAFKKARNIGTSTGVKPQEWLKVSDAFCEAVGLPGIPIGHVTVIRGHSDTGKSTLLLEAAAASQRQGRIPVFIVTEQKFSLEHANQIGVQLTRVIDEDTAEVTYEGDFIYVDLESLTTIEDVAKFIIDLLDEQSKGKIPVPGLDFLWDSAGTVPAQQSIDSKTFNNEWAAASYSRNFSNFITQRITLSRKASSPYTNSLIVVNKVWVDKPATYGALPVMKNKGGNALYSDSSIVITFGGVTTASVSKIKAVKDKKEVEFGKRVRVQVEKNHINGITTTTKVIATPHGFIKETPGAIDKYKKEHRHEWLNVLGDGEISVIEEYEDDNLVADSNAIESED
jgi:hypothetical protein